MKKSVAAAIIAATPLALTGLVNAAGGGGGTNTQTGTGTDTTGWFGSTTSTTGMTFETTGFFSTTFEDTLLTTVIIGKCSSVNASRTVCCDGAKPLTKYYTCKVNNVVTGKCDANWNKVDC